MNAETPPELDGYESLFLLILGTNDGLDSVHSVVNVRNHHELCCRGVSDDDSVTERRGKSAWSFLFHQGLRRARSHAVGYTVIGCTRKCHLCEGVAFCGALPGSMERLIVLAASFFLLHPWDCDSSSPRLLPRAQRTISRALRASQMLRLLPNPTAVAHPKLPASPSRQAVCGRV
jgi:hypothetical protein